MNVQDLLKLHDETTQKCKGIMERKNSDYTGGSSATDALANFKTAAALGLHPVTGLLLRMQDKLMRVRSFVADGKLRVTGETVEDACDDMVNYAILCKALILEEASSQQKVAEDLHEQNAGWNIASKEYPSHGDASHNGQVAIPASNSRYGWTSAHHKNVQEGAFWKPISYAAKNWTPATPAPPAPEQ